MEPDDSIDIVIAPEPILVQLASGYLDTNSVASDYSSWNTYHVSGSTTENAVQILPQNSKRLEAKILVQAGYDDNNTTGAVILGRREQMSNRQGAAYAYGADITYKGAGAVFLIGDGNGDHFTVTVLDELYARG